MALSVATSIDALAVGLSLAFLGTEIWWPSIAIGVITCGFSLAGIFLGKKLNEMVGKRMEIAGGLILIAIGVQILVDTSCLLTFASVPCSRVDGCRNQFITMRRVSCPSGSHSAFFP